jgi:hypothetical protein
MISSGISSVPETAFATPACFVIAGCPFQPVLSQIGAKQAPWQIGLGIGQVLAHKGRAAVNRHGAPRFGQGP